jgi:uncharacterized protein (TIGR00290 family)
MRTILSWSSGKDSAWTLHTLRQTPGIELIGLVTTVNETVDRVAMHGVRRTLLEAQARAARLELHTIPLPAPCPNDVYEARMAAFIDEARSANVEAIAFGDLFLEDIRAYREAQLAGTGLRPLFPLWQQDTQELARQMRAAGLRAKVTCLDPGRLPRAFAGRDFDEGFLLDLEDNIDPCGENGEFHTFAYAGPMFAGPIDVAVGEVVERDGFVFADLDFAAAGPGR